MRRHEPWGNSGPGCPLAVLPARVALAIHAAGLVALALIVWAWRRA